MPKYPKTWLNISSAVSIAVGRFLWGINLQDLENRSTITRIQVFPLEAGKSVTKSTPRCDHGRLGMGRGRSLPAGRWRELLEIAHYSQPWTSLLTFLAMFGHQKRSFSSERVALAPGWPVHRVNESALGPCDILYTLWTVRRSARGVIGGRSGFRIPLDGTDKHLLPIS